MEVLLNSFHRLRKFSEIPVHHFKFGRAGSQTFTKNIIKNIMAATNVAVMLSCIVVLPNVLGFNMPLNSIKILSQSQQGSSCIRYTRVHPSSVRLHAVRLEGDEVKQSGVIRLPMDLQDERDEVDRVLGGATEEGRQTLKEVGDANVMEAEELQRELDRVST